MTTYWKSDYPRGIAPIRHTSDQTGVIDPCPNGVAIGTKTNSGRHALESVTIGNDAYTKGFNNEAGVRNIALGDYVIVTGTENVAIGQAAGARGFGTTAVGSGANYLGSVFDYRVAIGLNTYVEAERTTVVGAFSQASAAALRAVVIGNDARGTVANGLSLGYQAATASVASGGAGVAIVVPTDSRVAAAPGAATDKLIIMINGVRYHIALTAAP